MKKVIKTTHTRTVIPSVSDTLSLDGGGSAVGGYTTPVAYRPVPGGGPPMDYPTHTVPRNYHFSPPGGYNDYRGGPPPEAYVSLSRGAHMDDRYRCLIIWNQRVYIEICCLADHSLMANGFHLNPFRPVHPDGYRTLDPNYRSHSRNQLDPYAAQPQVCLTFCNCF